MSMSPGIPLLLLEAALTLVIVALAMGCHPRARHSSLSSRLENLFRKMARRRSLAVLVTGLGAGILRLLILPVAPIPMPVIQDDFSYLLAAETFASGRLTNPTDPLWVHFESFHITHFPTYMSMYFPAQGMMLAAGKLIFGHPWFGVWASCALMCAAICWMLQGWLPPGWAFLGGVLATLRLALFSYWIDTYTGGSVAAIGGALVLGALPRIWRMSRTRDFFWMALGMAILANSRPYEGLLVCVPSVLFLIWQLAKKSCISPSLMVRRVVPAALLLLATVAFMAYYNYRLFGSVFTPPYAVNRATYASAPHFIWQSPRPEPKYRHKVLRDFYHGEELRSFLESRTPTGFFKTGAVKALWMAMFFLGFALLPAVGMLPWVLRDGRIRFLLVSGAIFAIGLAAETWLIPHYVAPFTAAFYAILLQCLRHLRVWRPGGRPSGLFLVRAIPALCLVLAILCAFAQQLHIQRSPDRGSTQAWYGTRPLGLERAHVVAELESHPGPQLAIVRYSPQHDSLIEWVYNAADIDRSKVVWAREMNPADNQNLLNYYNGRTAWLVEPDSKPPRVSPYRAEQLSLLHDKNSILMPVPISAEGRQKAN